jgi:hypothetical protein
MSDQSQGPGWWVASDGRWYPPEQHPNYTPPASSLPPPPPAGENRTPWYRRWWAICLWVLLGLSVVGAALGGDDDDGDDVDAVATTVDGRSRTPDDPTTTTTRQPVTTAAHVPLVVTLSGDGDQNTDTFQLNRGDYEVAYSFTGNCYYGGTLRDPDGDFLYEDLGSGSGPVSGNTNVYDLDGGTYYVDLITGPAPSCPWLITLTER